jgi:putative SOS response-associated peptidase YedK
VCGRYTLAGPDPSVLRARFPLGEGVRIERRYNVAPGDDVVGVIRRREHEAEGTLLRWGLVPHWAKDPRVGYRTINARAESIDDRPAFRRAFERHRCLIVADGFYEWRRDERGAKLAFHITRPDREPFAFAGLWSAWHRGEPDEVRSCTIVTTAANASIAPLHDRMPVILVRANEDVWLDHGTPLPVLLDVLHGLPAAETALRPVGPAVNDARYDGPACLDDAPPEPLPQAALF